MSAANLAAIRERKRQIIHFAPFRRLRLPTLDLLLRYTECYTRTARKLL